MVNAVCKDGAYHFCIVYFKKRRNKMIIILKKDSWDGLTFVKNHLDKAKLFKSLQEAQDYCEEFEIEQFQLVDIAI
jgi:hypothetical protein